MTSPRVYGVETRALNQAVQRNVRRFPRAFAFRLTATEAAALRSQFVISNAGRGGRRSLPMVFTEHGAIMAASVLNSPRAVDMSVFVVKAFVSLRDMASTQAELSKRLSVIERQVAAHDTDLKDMFAALRRWLAPPNPPRRPIGFLTRR